MTFRSESPQPGDRRRLWCAGGWVSRDVTVPLDRGVGRMPHHSAIALVPAVRGGRQSCPCRTAPISDLTTALPSDGEGAAATGEAAGSVVRCSRPALPGAAARTGSTTTCWRRSNASSAAGAGPRRGRVRRGGRAPSAPAPWETGGVPLGRYFPADAMAGLSHRVMVTAVRSRRAPRTPEPQDLVRDVVVEQVAHLLARTRRRSTRSTAAAADGTGLTAPSRRWRPSARPTGPAAGRRPTARLEVPAGRPAPRSSGPSAASAPSTAATTKPAGPPPPAVPARAAGRRPRR